MTANVIQHRKPRRKRAGTWTWSARHFGLLAVALIGVFAASWLAPEMAHRSPAPATTPQALLQVAPSSFPPVVEIEIRADLARPASARTRSAARGGGVPLNASAALRTDDFEILSAAELDGISQARD
jgi:hypothetical protein